MTVTGRPYAASTAATLDHEDGLRRFGDGVFEEGKTPPAPGAGYFRGAAKDPPAGRAEDNPGHIQDNPLWIEDNPAWIEDSPSRI
jgi:hypothetical protein